MQSTYRASNGEQTELRQSELERVGKFSIKRRLGEGGFGTVYLASQSEPVKRDVAVKIIKLGMDTEEVLARFRAEQQALASLDHPNIAKVFDAGLTDEGRPYFVMEFIKGDGLLSYCDRNHLVLTERLQLFLQLCDAVAYAHQRGIIHRDLKPANILVAEHSSKPIPKVIDFGVAKAMSGSAQGMTLLTGENQLIGTPAYMSPEQSMGSEDIDVRSDVFALGVILFQLLTDATPLDAKTTRKTSREEVLRRIREDDSPRPSTFLRRIPRDRLAEISMRRQQSPKGLYRQVRGDLDWVAVKALARERDRRYHTPLHLADDIKRVLRHRSIEARPPSIGYLTKKFIRRNRVACALAGITGAGILVGVGGIVAGAKAEKRQALLVQEEAKKSRALSSTLNE
ncbi:MAG: serine/threonine-protein kinase, partial [Verrucomicrobiota bacterium]